MENSEKRMNNVPVILSPWGNVFVVNVFYTAIQFRGKRVSWTDKQKSSRNNTTKTGLSSLYYLL